MKNLTARCVAKKITKLISTSTLVTEIGFVKKMAPCKDDLMSTDATARSEFSRGQSGESRHEAGRESKKQIK